MLRLFLLRLWPALIPLIAYFLWMRWRNRVRHKQGLEAMRLREGPWLAAVLCSIFTAGVLLVILGTEGEMQEGSYVPPKLVDGKVVEGHFEP